MTPALPRLVTSVLVEEDERSVTVTWDLGEAADVALVEYFGYGVDYYGPDGNGGKRFGVRFHEKVTAHVFEWSSNTQANYEADSVTIAEDAIVVHFRDATIGLSEVGTIHAFSQVNGTDLQVQLPVTLVR
ncbi:hypothetical protein ACFWN7_11800 [Agromyces sp. NPDC058484]|uniref:hypothetical protein n=1 Tax=Agromyces sp. NPDC058484 TaxID=3346524 RepID=UPI003669FF1A